MNYQKLFDERAKYSDKRLVELSTRLARIPELNNFPKLTIFGAGSYARLEASGHSDIDMFFLNQASPTELTEPKTNRIKLFANIINIVNEMNFPSFSNDGEFLEILHTKDMLGKLGGKYDDYENHFTTRMLLLLESKCLFGDMVYKQAISTLIRSYFRDFPRHKNNFKPIFLMNDIMRYWKTLCLNYEHKRRDTKKTSKNVVIKQKVRNFKLKYSRMTTCFATIAYLACQLKLIDEEDVNTLVLLTPRQRLEKIPDIMPNAKNQTIEILEKYAWFLNMTALPIKELEERFSDKTKRQKAFSKANEYGNSMFRLLQLVDKKYDVFRYLVI